MCVGADRGYELPLGASAVDSSDDDEEDAFSEAEKVRWLNCLSCECEKDVQC